MLSSGNPISHITNYLKHNINSAQRVNVTNIFFLNKKRLKVILFIFNFHRYKPSPMYICCRNRVVKPENHLYYNIIDSI